MSKIIITTKEELSKIVENSINDKLNDLTKLIKEKINPSKTNLTVKEVSKFLNVSELTVRNYISKGIIKAEKIGRKIIINKTELEDSLSIVKSFKYKR